nr:LOW QUALITY PROTEIN: serpin-ZX-like [Solanum lycopersicum]
MTAITNMKCLILSFHVCLANLIKAAEVVDQVNQWTKMKTDGLIEEILDGDAVDNMTRLILANALYFKGEWNEKFDASETKDHEFHLLDGLPIQVPFMTSKKKQHIAEFNGFKVMRLPYKQGKDTGCFSMYFILPDAHDGLPALFDKFSTEAGFLTHHVPFKKVSAGKFLIPEFKITFEFEASDILKGLGLTLSFCGGGLTEMIDSTLPENISVSKVFHKSFIEVNEEGTEAAAVTVTLITPMSLFTEKEIDFVADHPFLFFIKDESTGVVLFIGSVQ